jgi:hypothetical protein
MGTHCRIDRESREGVWAHLKRSLANLAKHTIDQVAVLVKTRLKRMQYRPGLIAGFAARTGLDFKPPLTLALEALERRTPTHFKPESRD